MTGEIVNPFVGGLLIGLAATLLLFFSGRILGVSGIVGGLLSNFEKWRLSFLLGMIISAGVLFKLKPAFFAYEIPVGFGQIILAGLLVGFGTRMGSGCTSGHGVCGLPRLSMRSLVATGLFMGSAIIVVSILEVLNA